MKPVKLIVEAIVAGRSQVLADGLVRVHVTDTLTGATVGRLSLTEGVWTWMRDWIIAAESMGVIGPGMDMEIMVREREHRVGDGKRAETMRGRLLEAVEKRAGMTEDATAGKGSAENQPGARDGQGAIKSGRVGLLWRRVQEHKSKNRGN